MADRQKFSAPAIDVSRFAYDPETGIVTRKTGAKAGQPVGTLNHHGYLQTTINGAFVAVHRLAWRIQTGEWPMFRLDHEDTDKANNRWKNLRPATNSQNGMNKGIQSNNSTGYKGVHYRPDQTFKPWVAIIVLDQEHRWLGSFATAIEAAWAYDQACRKLHGAFASPNGVPCPGRSRMAKGALGLEGVAVRVQKTRTVYRALATIGEGRHHIGNFVTPFDAALAYDDWITTHGHGDRKRINYPLIQLGRFGTTIFDDFWPERA